MNIEEKNCKKSGVREQLSYPMEDNQLLPTSLRRVQQAAAGHVGEGAHFMGGTHGLNFAQIVGGQLIEAGDAEQSHGGHDFVFQYFENPY